MMIVVGVSDTTHGEAAARRAVHLADQFGSSLRAVHVSHVPASMVAALATVPTPMADFSAAQRAAVWERIGPILDAAEGYRAGKTVVTSLNHYADDEEEGEEEVQDEE